MVLRVSACSELRRHRGQQAAAANSGPRRRPASAAASSSRIRGGEPDQQGVDDPVGCAASARRVIDTSRHRDTKVADSPSGRWCHPVVHRLGTPATGCGLDVRRAVDPLLQLPASTIVVDGPVS